MGKPTGFMEYKSKKVKSETVKKRIKHYKEFNRLPVLDQVSTQGARCMDCGVPFCHSPLGCPVSNLIPEWNDLVYKNLWKEAYLRLESTNNFPEFTGRLCPAPCESACTLSINDQPVTIKQIELAIIEYAYEKGWVLPRPPQKETGKRIAIIGSGPAGLAAAQQLRRLGHDVTVFERSDKLGGLLRYGIPDFKLDKRVIDRRLTQLLAEGIKFRTDIDIGEDISTRYLNKSYDVILLATGAGKERDLGIPGRKLKGIVQAMTYLTQSNKFVSKLLTEDQIISAKNKKVLILGGGDTGADCVGTAIRQKANQVYQYEIMPKPDEWQKSWNPDWPQWPKIVRTSSSHEEGCKRDWAVLTKKFIGKNHSVSAVNCSRIKWVKENNNSWGMKDIKGSDFTIEVDLVILAVGFEHVEYSRLVRELEIDFDNKGNINNNKAYQTSQKNIYSAGDAHTGASLIVTAIDEGRKAAAAIHDYLNQG